MFGRLKLGQSARDAVSYSSYFDGDDVTTDRTQDEALIALVRSGKLQEGVRVRAADRLEVLIAEKDALVEVLRELTDLMDKVYAGDYTPDSFTTQPARKALAKHGEGL